MHQPARLRQGRSLAPLVAIVVVIALPNLLTAGLHRTPILTTLLGPESVRTFPLLQTVISLVFIVVGIAIWWFGSRATVRRLIVGYAAIATVVLGAALFSLV